MRDKDNRKKDVLIMKEKAAVVVVMFDCSTFSRAISVTISKLLSEPAELISVWMHTSFNHLSQLVSHSQPEEMYDEKWSSF